MKVIKRNGAEVEFDIVKIIAAVTKANAATEEDARMTPVQLQRIAESVELACQGLGRAPTVEEIQDFVEHQIMAHGAFEVAKRYITYRYTRSLVRRSNTTDEKILSLIEFCNEEAKQENSNKNPVINSTQRDYMAGEVSRVLTQRMLLPEDIVDLPANVFRGCFSLTRVKLSEHTQKIGAEAFSGCSELSSLLIPESVEHIGEGAFNGTADRRKRKWQW